MVPCSNKHYHYDDIRDPPTNSLAVVRWLVYNIKFLRSIACKTAEENESQSGVSCKDVARTASHREKACLNQRPQVRDLGLNFDGLLVPESWLRDN